MSSASEASSVKDGSRSDSEPSPVFSALPADALELAFFYGKSVPGTKTLRLSHSGVFRIFFSRCS